MVKRLQVWLNRGQPNLPSPSLQAAVAVVIDRRRRGEHQLGASIENLRSLSPLTTGRACLMSTKSSSIQCPRCYTQVPEASFQYCPNCGSAVNAKTPSRLWLVARIVPPLVTLWGSFLAWVRVAALAPNHNRWNVYHFGHGGLAWLAGDVVCLLIVAASLARPEWVSNGLWTAWKVFGGLSLGLALSMIVSAHMGATIAALVNAPSPFQLASGVFVFGLGSLLWIGLGFAPTA